MIRGTDKILQFLEKNNCVYFQLRPGPEKDAYIFQSNIEGETPEMRKARFIDVLETLEPGKYYLEGWSTEGQKRNWFRDYVYIGESQIQYPTATAVGNVPQSMSYPSEDIERRIAEAVERTQLKIEVETLRKELKECNEYIDELEEKGDSLNRIIGRLEPYIGPIVGALLGKGKPAVSVSGTTADIQGNNEDFANVKETDETERIKVVCQRLEALEPNYLSLLELLCDKLEQNPALLQMIKNYV